MRGTAISVRAGDAVVRGQIERVRPDRLVLALDAPLPAVPADGRVVITAGELGRATVEVVGVEATELVVRRPVAAQAGFQSKRRFQRFPVEVPARLAVRGEPLGDGHTADLSPGGALVTLPGAVPLGLALDTPVQVALRLDDDGEVVIEATVRYVGSGPTRVGLRFGLMSPNARGRLLAVLSAHVRAEQAARAAATSSPAPVLLTDAEPQPDGAPQPHAEPAPAG